MLLKTKWSIFLHIHMKTTLLSLSNRVLKCDVTKKRFSELVTLASLPLSKSTRENTNDGENLNIEQKPVQI